MVSRSPRAPAKAPLPPVSPGPSLFDMLSERGPKPQEPEYKGFQGFLAKMELGARAWSATVPWRQLARGVVLLALVAAGGAAYHWRVVLMEKMTVSVAQATGAVVQRIVVSGVTYTRKEDLQAALALNKGDSLVGFDASAARARIEKLPWVRLASVDRQLPDAVNVVVYEHAPLARVIDAPHVWVVNKEGQRIVDDAGVNAFTTLPVIAGEEAPEAAGALFAALGAWPALLGQLKEAVYVEKRRWDLKFISGVVVQLPETTGDYGLNAALPVLARLEETRHVLTLNAGTVDLRLKDRVILHLPDAVGATPVTQKPASAG